MRIWFELMEGAEQKFTSMALPGRLVSHRSAFLRNARRLVFLSFLIWASFAGQAGDMYDTTLDQRFAEPPGSTNFAPENADSPADPNLAAIASALKAEQEREAEGPPELAPEPISRSTWMLLGAGLLAVILAFLKMIQWLNEKIKNRRLLSKEAEEALARDKLIVEQPSLVAFFNELRFGLGTAAEAPAAETIGPQMSRKEGANRLRQFYKLASGSVGDLRAQLSKINRAPDKVVRLELLREFFCQLDALKGKATLPELRPVWLMACGLEGLVQQLSMTAANINPSVLRTAAGAVDLLEILCVPGVDPNLATRTPVELLAADDNPVCLSALSLALKKAFREPDLAVDGTSGLVSADKKRYDVIFLDVEMPGMDGFELCAKIREGKLNRTTPVVFVTSHSDFDSRTKSTLVGGQDLIAKPYLSFEITVKALTLALRGRLANDKSASQPASKKTPAVPVLGRPLEVRV
jgi:CheY-like chemotaxis protein